MSYEETITTLFELLAQANLADSEQAENWQSPNDANQNRGYYGLISNAIISIAGSEIVDHWVKTNEIDILLAARNS